MGLSTWAAPRGIAASDEPIQLSLGRVRALVISPHPDDATLGAAGLIQRVIRQRGTVRVVQLTDGDGFSRGVLAIRPGVRPTPLDYRWYGAVREREAVEAMQTLGLHGSQVSLLGFPDDGLCALASTFRVGPPYDSPYTRRQAPPEEEQLVPGTMYRGLDLVTELANLIEEFHPTLVAVPHSGDQHPDHCATHLFVHDALAVALAHGVPAPRVLHYLVHFPDWPGIETPDQRVNPPGAALARDWTWTSLQLTREERAHKRAALVTFRSQALVMGEFLAAFVRANELFIEGEPPLPIPCWCGGENITAAKRTVH